jgi:hypothetical protein
VTCAGARTWWSLTNSIVDNIIVNGEACMKCWGKVAKGVEAFLRREPEHETPQRKNGRRKQVA